MKKKTTFHDYKENQRLLNDGFASCAIEGMAFSKEEREFMKGMYNAGLSGDEMVAEIKKRMGIAS